MLALAGGVTIAWWVSLGFGLVIAIVVWALLETLRRRVHDVRRAVDEVLAMGGQVAQNTWTIQLLETTKSRGSELLEELRLHRPERREG